MHPDPDAPAAVVADAPTEPWEQELDDTFDDTPPQRSALGLLGHLLAGVVSVCALIAALLAIAAALQWIFT